MKKLIVVGFFVFAIIISYGLFNRYPDTVVAPPAPAPTAVVVKIAPLKVKAKKATHSRAAVDPVCSRNGSPYRDGQGFFADYAESMDHLEKVVHDCKAAEQKQ